MPDNRKRCFESIVNSCGCNVSLISPSNIDLFTIKSSPLHEAYEYLSLTHRADYLRAYLMYHYGGGYTDIKFNSFDWKNMFNYLYNTRKQFIGYQEMLPEHIASADIEIKNSYFNLPGVVHFIFKKYTQIAKIWLDEVHLILDKNKDKLKKHPGNYHPRAIYGGAFQTDLFKGSQYPFGWNQLLGSVFHKVCYENMQEYDLIMPYPNTSNYR